MEKKKVYDFLIKSTFICWTRLKTKKHLATGKQLIRKNSACCLKIRLFFSQSERKDRPDPPPPVNFSLLYKNPSPFSARRTSFLTPISYKHFPLSQTFPSV